MTIEREEPGLLVAICDQCGERRYLDLEPDADDKQMGDALKALGWRQEAPAQVKFEGGSSYGYQTLIYPQDFCADCQGDEPRPRPRFGSGRACRQAVAPLANDPVDEWPRALVFEAAGLNPACGHPPGGFPCGHCANGFPIGRTDAWWRR